MSIRIAAKIRSAVRIPGLARRVGGTSRRRAAPKRKRMHRKMAQIEKTEAMRYNTGIGYVCICEAVFLRKGECV